MSDSGASPGDTRPASKGPVTLARPLAFTLPLHRGIILRISAFFRFNSCVQSFLSLLSKHIHLQPPPSSPSPQYPLNSHGFYSGLGTHRQVNQASWFTDNKSREEISSELVKIAAHAFISTTLWPDKALNPRANAGLRVRGDLRNNNQNIVLASAMQNQSFIMTIICAFPQKWNTANRLSTRPSKYASYRKQVKKIPKELIVYQICAPHGSSWIARMKNEFRPWGEKPISISPRLAWKRNANAKLAHQQLDLLRASNLSSLITKSHESSRNNTKR